jgi:hypothetical protein
MISVPGAEKLSLVEIEAFLTASDSVRFVGSSRVEPYQWVERLLCHHEYPLLGRRSKGLLRAYIERMTGSLDRAQRFLRPGLSLAIYGDRKAIQSRIFTRRPERWE